MKSTRNEIFSSRQRDLLKLGAAGALMSTGAVLGLGAGRLLPKLRP